MSRDIKAVQTMEICRLICQSIGVNPALVRKLSLVIEADEPVLITVESYGNVTTVDGALVMLEALTKTYTLTEVQP